MDGCVFCVFGNGSLNTVYEIGSISASFLIIVIIVCGFFVSLAKRLWGRGVLRLYYVSVATKCESSLLQIMYKVS